MPIPVNVDGFEPKIVAFLCTWCSYTGADTAGIARLKYPYNMVGVRVPCSGRVSPEILMRTFDQGADGVLILGCHIGECHYDTGNHRTAKRLPVLKSLLEFAGLEPDRLRLDWVSASEGERFARIVGEFTEAVRRLGPSRWIVDEKSWRRTKELSTVWEQSWVDGAGLHFSDRTPADFEEATDSLRQVARQLLENGDVSCVIGYEVGPRGVTRPAFIHGPDQVDRLVWNRYCHHNLTTYLRQKLKALNGGHQTGEKVEEQKRIAVVVKPCDSRTINVLIGENQLHRDQVHVIGMVCDGIFSRGKSGQEDEGPSSRAALQDNCRQCQHTRPLVYDMLIGEPPVQARVPQQDQRTMLELKQASPADRSNFWLEQFDRCIRCYACRQACPICNCPTCLYERDDSLWVGMGTGLNEKRAFHLGRAYHLAGRCIDCHECENACPVGVPISLLNQLVAQEIEEQFAYRAGEHPGTSPFLTILSGEERLP
jgi:coenzyme F420-reducing hydrogenase delta subunit/ferredoxin